MENSVIKIYKQAVAANSTRYYDMINRYQVTQQWKRLKRTLQLFKHPVPHAKPSRHNCLKESIESFACVEGGRASSEQITITQHFLAQAKINWSQESWKEKKKPYLNTCDFIFTNPSVLIQAVSSADSAGKLLEAEQQARLKLTHCSGFTPCSHTPPSVSTNARGGAPGLKQSLWALILEVPGEISVPDVPSLRQNSWQ